MTHYIAIVHKDADSAFGVSFPDVPGCFSAADEEKDLLSNAMEALELFAEDQPMPAPSPIEKIRERNDVREDIMEGAYLLAVPFVRNARKSTRVNVTLDKGLLAAIDEAAEQRRMTRSGFLAQAAEREIGR